MGGRMGGRSPYIGLWSSWIYLNFGKKTHFQGYMRGVHGGADGGVLKWRGGWGGDFWHTWGGAGGAFQLLLKHFLTQKLRFFEMDAILIIKYWRPPMRPPPIMWLAKYENMEGDHEPQSKIMFLRSLVMFTSFHGRPYEIFSIFELLELMPWIWKFRRKAKNRWHGLQKL